MVMYSVDSYDLQVRDESAAVVEALHFQGYDVWMLTGDQPATAHAVAAQLRIPPERVLSSVLPSGKLEAVRSLQQEHRRVVAMVGDGINDAAALALADVGIAVSSGSDIALEAAGVVLLKNNLQDVLVAFDISRKAFRTIRFNFFWAFLYNLVGMLLAAGAFYAVGGLYIPPAIAGLSELLSSLPVICFSLLLKRYRFQPVDGRIVKPTTALQHQAVRVSQSTSPSLELDIRTER